MDLDLNIIFTHPEHRRQGIAELMLQWGVSKAAEMQVEMWLDATVQGRPLYAKHGFELITENDLCPEVENPSEEWKAIDRELRPITMWLMRRPAH